MPRNYRFDYDKTLLKAFIFAALYALILASLPVAGFEDRPSYFRYSTQSDTTFHNYFSSGLGRLFSNEPLWLTFNVLLEQFLNPSGTVRVIVFFASFLTTFAVLKNNSKSFALLCLFFIISPQILSMHLLHLRHGLAIGFFVTGFYCKNGGLKTLFVISSAFIHAAFFFIIPLWVVAVIGKNFRFSIGLQFLTLIGCCLSMIAAIDAVTIVLNARQASFYSENNLYISGLGFLFWISILMIVSTEKRHFLQKHCFSISILILYLLSYHRLQISARLLESGIPLLLPTFFSMRRWRRAAVVTLYTFFCIYFAAFETSILRNVIYYLGG